MTCVELIVEFFEVLEYLFHMRSRRHQVCDAEMVGPRGLTEARAWYCHDAGFVDHLHAVDEVRFFTLLLCIVDKALREVDSREAIHGALNLGACDLLHIVESIS